MSAPVGYSFHSANNMGPIAFGSTSSGSGVVTFGASNPTLTTFIAQMQSNPLLLVGVGVVALIGLSMILKSRRKVF